MLATPLYLLGSVEVGVLSLLLAPVKPLNAIGISICGMALSSVGTIVSATLAVFLLAFLGFALLELSRVPVVAVTGFESSNSYASQVVALSAGMDLVIGLVLVKLSAALASLEKLQTSHGALKKQAENLSTEYKRLMEEAEGKPKPKETKADAEPKKVKESSASSGDDKAKIERELKTANATIAAMKKQAEGLSTEYGRLQGENEDLKDQLKDMDKKSAHREAKKGD
mmetsp:Transcript_10361/g.12120  ORF Transcript_10361/g.12120 Transcript_10361/m.12120 type:complete len:227 (+) Transcript_10361:144-824(+)